MARDRGRSARRDSAVVAAVDLAAETTIISPEQLFDGLSAHLVSTADMIAARLGHRVGTSAGAI